MSETMKNVKDVLTAEEAGVTPVTEVDPAIAVAYAENEKNTKHIQEVNKELDKLAKDANPESEPEFGKMPENTYTKKLTLDEGIEDQPTGATLLSDEPSEDERDTYLDYDMFDFIYGLVVAQTWPKPLNPLGHKMRTFQYMGEDDYRDSNSNKGVSQVGVENDAIVVYANEEEAFNDVKEVCDMYQIEYEGPRAKKSPDLHWNYSFKIFVPMIDEDCAMLTEDYFDSIGMSLEQVMPLSFVTTYRNKQRKAKDALKKMFADQEKSRQDERNEAEISRIYDKYVHEAGRNGDIPLRTFIRDMFSEMEGSGLKFNRAQLKKRFEDEFLDDFDEEEDE